METRAVDQPFLRPCFDPQAWSGDAVALAKPNGFQTCGRVAGNFWGCLYYNRAEGTVTCGHKPHPGSRGNARVARTWLTAGHVQISSCRHYAIVLQSLKHFELLM